MNEAMEFFKFILDNQQEIQKQVIQDVFNIIKTKDDKINEYIMEELSHFDFSIVERELISNIVGVIDSSLKPLDNPSENNYEAIKNNLMNNLKLLKLKDYKLENNFSDLSRKMATKFNLSENYINEFYSYFMSKSELITNSINKTNNNILDTLIKYSPNLIDEIEQSRNNVMNSSINSNNQVSQESQSKVQSNLDELARSIDKKIEEVNNQRDYNEMMDELESAQNIDKTEVSNKNFQTTDSNILNSQMLDSRAKQIARIVRNVFSQGNLKLDGQKINKVYKSLIKISLNEILIEKYKNSLDYSNKNIYDYILICEIDGLKEFLDVYGIDLNYLEFEEKKIEPDSPKPDEPKTPEVSTYVGATNEDIEKLIRSNEYYSLLHGINREAFMQYNAFIQTGYNLITNDYYNRAASCNTLEERLNALAELKEIYNNFNGYITLDQSNQLRETIENLSNYLSKEQSQQMIDDIGIRYNGENSREVNSGRRM